MASRRANSSRNSEVGWARAHCARMNSARSWSPWSSSQSAKIKRGASSSVAAMMVARKEARGVRSMGKWYPPGPSLATSADGPDLFGGTATWITRRHSWHSWAEVRVDGPVLDPAELPGESQDDFAGGAAASLGGGDLQLALALARLIP